MCHALLQTPAFFALLRRIDEDLMKVARDRGCCHCGSVLHSANYPRKPRGCPPAAHPDCNTRLSLCVDFHAILTPVFHPILTPPVGV